MIDDIDLLDREDYRDDELPSWLLWLALIVVALWLFMGRRGAVETIRN